MEIIKFIGFDGSTTTLSACAYTESGKMFFASTPMLGVTLWHGQPAFDLSYLPEMLERIITILGELSDYFAPDGAVCFSWRQHDMVLLNKEGKAIIPALSWQCNAATKEVIWLRSLGVEKTVGRIEERFILPKLLWALKQDQSLREQIDKVMTTADYIAFCLTGNKYLSTSDGLSNGLVKQTNKTLAVKVLQKASIPPWWFPSIIQSGDHYPGAEFIGCANGKYAWKNKVMRKLYGWSIMGSLGDNHAGAIGCGLSGFDTIVVSAGSSGTVVRLCHNNATTKGRAVNFEFFNRRMLLMMVADCATRFVHFADEYGFDKSGKKLTFDELDQLVPDRWTPAFVGALDSDYENAMATLISLGEKVAYVRYTIASQLGELVYKIKNEVKQRELAKKIIFTGGMMKSDLFRDYLKTYLDFLDLPIYMLEGEIGSKTAPYGALITAMVGSGYFPNLKTATREMCKLVPI